MAARVYEKLRTLIKDTTSSYDIIDLLLLDYLDEAIDVASSILGYTVMEDIDVTQADITNGYKEFSHPVVEIYSGFLESQHYNWEYDNTSRRIRLINSDLTPTTYQDVRYKAGYKKFDGELREQDYMDLPREAEIGTAFIAAGLYLADRQVVNPDGTGGILNSKSEGDLSVSYSTSGGDGSLKSPRDFINFGKSLLRKKSNAEPMFFTVRTSL